MSVSPIKRDREWEENSDVSSTTEVVEKASNVFTADTVQHLFQFLSLKDLASAAQVCRLWRRVASNISFLDHYCRQDAAGFFIVTVPEELSSLNTLLKWAECKKIKMGQVDRSIRTKIGDQEVAGTWKITDSGVEGTGNMTLAEQQQKISGYGYEMQSLVPALALNLFTYLKTKTWLLKDEPLTYIRLSGSYVIGGANDKHGPNIRSYDGNVKVEHYYAGAMQKI